MKKLRKEDLSLHHCIRFNILDEYIETDYNVPLQYLPDVSTLTSKVYQAVSTRYPAPNSLGRGWVYLDVTPGSGIIYEDMPEQQNMVIVYDSLGNVISGSEYMVDYVDGRVVTSGTVSPASVTYSYFYVALCNDWEDVMASDVPVIVPALETFTKEGFQLGGGRLVPRRGRLYIFATNQAERDDLAELLYDGINQKCCPNQNWTHGTMLDWDGTFNDNYLYEVIQYHSQLQFENVTYRMTTVPLMSIPTRDMTMLSDLNRYRARVDFTMFHWEEG
jgi:hypothetical protein